MRSRKASRTELVAIGALLLELALDE